ncbi:MAG: hypothetical protein NC184_06780 [Roseburia sp.]|nr:hypothetical protein [Roseburia sp.]
MNYSDDKMPTADGQDVDTPTADTAATVPSAPDGEKPDAARADDLRRDKSDGSHDAEDDGASGVSELAAFSVKVVAVVLSVVMMILSLLVVAMPLSAMRVYNKLGMSERALNSGDRYITSALGKRDATATDDIGNYTAAALDAELADDDFLEAIDVCSALSYKLMEQAADKGDTDSAAYFARRLEKYTRLYSSLYGVRGISNGKNAYNIATVPAAAMRPYVYSHAHTVRVRNYRARTYLGETDYMLYDSGRDGDCVIRTITLSNTFAGLVNKTSRLDDFVDYADMLGEYISVELDRLGVGDSLNEAEARDNFRGVMTGDEFSLFLDRADGFTDIYNQLKNFSEYAQTAIDTVPTDGANELDNRLHQLYRIQVLSSVSRKLWHMSMLLYYNADRYGLSAAKVREEYGTCEQYMWVTYRGGTKLMSEVYQIYLEQYLAICNA